MVAETLALVLGLGLLPWSADLFVKGSAAIAHRFHVPPLLIGILIIGLGTSAPEIGVSAVSALRGNPSLALGNAYGSNITNIALILGVTALVCPIIVKSRILRKEFPVLAAVTVLAAWQLRDGSVSTLDAWVLLGCLVAILAAAIRSGFRKAEEAPEPLASRKPDQGPAPLPRSLALLAAGLVMLIATSRALVWGASSIARHLGIGDLAIGLTIVAVGTSLPELASSVIAARRGEHDLALGNVIGSNLFNTLAVVGIAGAIHPMAVEPAVLSRDMLVMGGLTATLFLIAYSHRKFGRIDRKEGLILLTCYVAYTAFLARTVLAS